MKKTLLFLLIIYSQISFSQYDQTILNTLKGNWVKASNSKDTLRSPGYKDSGHTFNLTIGNNSKYGPAGAYRFTSLGTTMLVQWAPSGNSGATAIPFYINKEGTEIKIGNFYNASGEEKLLVFRKIK